jgi:hypothetical protein
MATTNRYITHSDITHIEVLVNDQDISVTDPGTGRRMLKLGQIYAYLDTDGITELLGQLLAQPEATERPELFQPVVAAAAVQQADLHRQAV